MKKTSWIVLAIILVLLGMLFVNKVRQGSSLSDEEQISAILVDGKAAVEEKNLRHILSYISEDYTDSAGLSSDSLRAMFIKAFRDNARYSITIKDIDMKLNGDTAYTTLDTTVYANYNPTDAQEVFTGPVQLVLKKEKSRKWLVFPADKWKVIGASGLPTGIGE
ncbi:MAG: Cif family virulence factor [Armatimonadota bacterium]